MGLPSLPYEINIFLILVGLLWSLSIVFELLSGLLRQIRRICPLNLLKRYGEGSWALVTGSTDGIGLAFAYKLAGRGFNIILLSRNRQKLENVANELRDTYKKIQVKFIVADLSQSYQPGFFDEIYKQIQDLDISILVNNAGLVFMEPFHTGNETEFKDLITVNTLPYVLLTRKLINHFRTRGKKSGIVNVTSLASLSPMAYMGLYGATKVFEDHLTRSLEIEYPEIDFISARPHFVSTKLTLHKQSFDTISTEDCAEGTLRDLGRYVTTGTHIKHDLAGWIMTKTPTFFVGLLSKYVVIPMEWERKKKLLENNTQKSK